MKRYAVNKGRSAAKFRHHVRRTKAMNMKPTVMRGGIRL